MNPADFSDWLKTPFSVQPTPGISDALRNYGPTNPSTSAISTPEKSSVQKLQDSVTFGKKLLENKKVNKATALQWAKQTRFAVFSLFGKDSAIGKNSDRLVKEADHPGLTLDQFAQRLADTDALFAYLNRTANSSLCCEASFTSRIPSTKNIFVIHGHDELNTRRLTQLLQNHFNLNPIAMLSKPGMSRPLIEKFEDEAQTCSFAFGLFTPDDEIVKVSKQYKQARPNVIYEVGWFIGRLGKHRVTLLLQDGTDIHSDLDGVSRIHFSDNVEDKFLDIQKELKAAKIIP
jgi:predicted nucleotide-binding protein